MSTVSPLPENTVSLLRSGQVITGASNVVKELVENAIDAKATNVEIKLEDFGINLIEVKDNGCGVSKDEVKLMTAPHHTSKIKSFDDLTSDRLRSYGFRGEALNTLCSVSELEIVTRSSTDLVGTLATFDKKGDVIQQTSIAATVGTTVRAKNLFSRLPVRRGFYQNSKNRSEEELRKIKRIVASFAIIKPGLRISLHHNKKEIFMKSPAKTFEDGLVQIFGREMFSDLQNIKLESSEQAYGSVKIFIAKNQPTAIKSASHSSFDKIFVFVNERPVTDKNLEKILKKNFPSNRHPVAVVVINVDADRVDVNLEPNKQTVYVRGQKEFELLLDATLSAHFDSSSLQSKSDANNSDVIDSKLHPRPSVAVVSHRKDDVQRPEERSAGKENFNTRVLLEAPDQPTTLPNRDSSLVVNFEPIVASASLETHSISKSVESNEEPRQFSFSETNSQGKLMCDKGTAFTQHDSPKNSASIRSDSEYHPCLQNENFIRSKSNPVLSNVREEPLPVPLQELNVRDATSNDTNTHNLKSTKCHEISKSQLSIYESWSRGNAIVDGQGSVVTPVTIGRPLDTRQKQEDTVAGDDSLEFEDGDFVIVKRASHLPQLSPPPFKKTRIERPSKKEPANQTKVTDLFNRQCDLNSRQRVVDKNESFQKLDDLKPKGEVKKKETHQRPTSLVNFRMNMLREKIFYNPHEVTDPASVNIIGQLNACKLWCYAEDGKLKILNHCCIQEVATFKRLMTTQALPSSPLLSGPKDLFSEPNWNHELTNVLLGLAESKDQVSVEIRDSRFVLNGIKIDVNLLQERALLTGIPSAVNFMGVDDVLEILKYIHRNPKVSVEDCRPLKVKNYFMGEAVRLMRQSPPGLDRASFEDILASKKKFNISKCLHSKPVDIELATL